MKSSRPAPADQVMMRAALLEALDALGRTHPNPAVGAVVVKAGRVVGRGSTRPPGGPHAEVVALRQAGKAAQGATVYSTMEPCNHFGRTPPCTEAIIAAGVRRVVFGSIDPNPLVDGAGLARLRRAGVSVVGPVLEREAEALNRPFFKFHRTGLPWVTLKAAISLDGKLAAASGDSRWITGLKAREWAHRLRDRVDAVLVGAGTVRADDPKLNTRLEGRDRRDPVRVVLDARLSVSPRAKVFAATGRALLVTAQPIDGRRASGYRAELWRSSASGGRIGLEPVLRRLAQEGLLHLMVEGGARVHASFLQAQLWDELVLFVAPKLLGDEGKTWSGPLGLGKMSEAIVTGPITAEQVGEDLMIHVLRK